MSVEAPILGTPIEAQGVYSLLTDKGTRVIARRPDGKLIYTVSGGCGTVIQTDKDARRGYMLSESVFISDMHGTDPRKNYPKKSNAPNGAERFESVVEWFNEGDEVTPELIHDHNGSLTAETPRGNMVRVSLKG